jgi:nitrile hydratase accessory protein
MAHRRLHIPHDSNRHDAASQIECCVRVPPQPRSPSPSAEGHFTWKEWAATLAEELKAAAEDGEPDDGSRYYHYWLAALEQLVMTKGLSDLATLLARKEAWADAYRHTPHGKPVELESDSSAL